MKMVTIYWRDIPSQVLVQQGRTKSKVLLPRRFQEAIDRAAMRAGKGSSDLYLEEWRRDSEQIEASEDLQAFSEEKARQIADRYDDEMLDKLIRNKGVMPEQG